MRKSVLIQVEEMKRGRGRPKITLKVEKMKCQLSRQQKVWLPIKYNRMVEMNTCGQPWLVDEDS